MLNVDIFQADSFHISAGPFHGGLRCGGTGKPGSNVLRQLLQEGIAYRATECTLLYGLDIR